MPSRRTFLTGVAAGSSALAGCSTLGDSLREARHGDDPLVPDGATVVATDEAFLDAAPHGAFRQRAAAYEWGDELRIYTDHQLVPGTNEYGTEWRLARLTVDHDYRHLPVGGSAEQDSNYVPVAPESGRVRIRLGYGSRAEDPERVSRFRIRYTPTSRATWGPTFATYLPLEHAVAPGGLLTRNRLTVRTTRGLLGRDEHELTTELVYGEEG